MKYKPLIILLFFGYALNTNEEQENIQYFIILSKRNVAKYPYHKIMSFMF